MKNAIAILLILVCCGCGGDPAAPLIDDNPAGVLEPLAWSWLNPTPQGEDVLAVDRKDGAAIAVGRGGAILMRRAGEVLWSAPVRPVAGDFEAVTMMTATRALAAGEDGILLTEDGGETWARVLSIGEGLEFRAIDSNGVNAVAAGDNLLFFSNDSGATWSPASVASTDNLSGVAFFASNGAVCFNRSGDMFRTLDSGAQWARVAQGQLPSGLIDIEFGSTDTGVAVSSFDIFRTADSGANWEAILNKTPIGAPIVAVSFAAANHGVIMTAAGQLLESTDNAATWQQTVDFTFETAALDMVAADAENFTAVGRTGFLADTFDGGADWSERTKGTRGDWVDVAFATDRIGVAVGRPDDNPLSGALITSSGGERWSTLPTPMEQARGVTFFNETLGLIVTFNGQVFRTTTTVTSWEDISPPDLPQTIEQFFAVAILDEQTYLVAGVASTVLKTTDGGASWQPTIFAVSPAKSAIGNIRGLGVFPGTQVVVAVGRDGMLRSEDEGETWTSSAEFDNLRGVACFSENEAVAATNSLLIRTSDRGLTWTPVHSLGNAPLIADAVQGEIERIADVAMRGRRGMAVGPLGVFLETLDGGLSWQPAQHITTETLDAVAFRGAAAAVAVGNGAIVGGVR